MRVVERTPWAERRSNRHDEMCLAVARVPGRLFPGFTGVTRVTVEASLGPGFVDLLAVTEAPANEVQAALVEVKTGAEQCSAGDVIRQLRWYRGRLPGRLVVTRPRLVLVVENDGSMPSSALELVQLAGIEVLPIRYFEEGVDAA